MKLPRVVLALSLAANVWLAYRAVDAGVSLSYAHDQQDSLLRDAQGCLSVLALDWRGRSEAHVLALPAKLKAQGLPEEDLYLKREHDTVSVLGISFRTAAGVVRDVAFYGDSIEPERAPSAGKK